MAITPNHTLDKLRAGKTAIGFGIHHLRGPVAGALAAASGFDWIFVDMEHGAMSVDQASAMCVAAQGQGVTPIVRCCRDALFEGTRCLDNGAMGVVVPHIDTAEDAAEMVRAFRFPPQGMRSWGGPPIQYGYRPPDTATAQAETDGVAAGCRFGAGFARRATPLQAQGQRRGKIAGNRRLGAVAPVPDPAAAQSVPAAAATLVAAVLRELQGVI
jgi:hypothetical protein